MSIRDRYQAYADAFELTFEDDDWSRLEEYFTEDAVYEGDPDSVGRDAIFANLKTSIDTFDRKMDRRLPDFKEPTIEGDRLVMDWTMTYVLQGTPDLVLSGVETATFKGDRIARLRDDFAPETGKRLGEWMAAHGAKLK